MLRGGIARDKPIILEGSRLARAILPREASLWIKLTNSDDTPILINTDKLEAIVPNDENRLTNLALHGSNEAYYVKESLDEIYKLINPKQNWN